MERTSVALALWLRLKHSEQQVDLIIVRLSSSAVIDGAECNRSYNPKIPRETSGVRKEKQYVCPAK